MNIKIFNEDCLDVFPSLGQVDLLITDPPYRINYTSGSATNSAKSERWQGEIGPANALSFDTTIDFETWIPKIKTVLKDMAHFYIFCNDKNINILLTAIVKAGLHTSNILVWKKNNATPNRWYMKNLEFIVFGYKGKAKPINNLGSKCIIECDNIKGKDKLHPTQKPTELLQVLIENSSHEGEVVFDPFMGSGSTGVACLRTGRNFIGVEKEQNFFEITKERLKQPFKNGLLEKALATPSRGQRCQYQHKMN